VARCTGSTLRYRRARESTPPQSRAQARVEVGDRPRTRRGDQPEEGQITTLVNGGRQRIPLDRIAIGDNVRELDADHVDALAASIKLRGLVVPVIVRVAGDDYELVAGYHRVAAHKKLGEANIDAEVRDVDTEHADRAIENVARKQLNPYEEAQAVRAISEASDIARYAKPGVI
jgi:ParB/Sulfiredoxin domain